MRAVDNRNILDKFCEEFCAVIEQFCEYIIVSGFVAISSGRARGTEDIDLIIERLDKEQFLPLHEAIKKAGFFCMQTENGEAVYDDYLKDNLSVRYTRENELLPEMELKMVKDELDKYQLKTKTKLPLTGLDIWFSSVNMNIAFKEHLLKSDKDLEDAKHLRIVYEELVDEKEIAKIERLIDRCRP